MSLVSELQQELTATYISISANVLFLFETSITFAQEFNVIWTRKWSMITWLYVVTRYTTLLLTILDLIPFSFETCIAATYVTYALQLTQMLCFAVFAALRVYALLNSKVLPAVVVLLLNLVPFATNIYNFATSEVVVNNETCVGVSLAPESIVLQLSLTTRIAAVIGDLLVLAVTWLKTAQLYREARRLKIEASLATTLLHDGTVYFVILLIINVLQMLENNLSDVFFIQVSAPFLLTLPFVIVCRFILNLRQVKPTGETSTSGSTPAATSSLRFVGNIGQSLHVGAGDEGDEIMPSTQHPHISTLADTEVHGSSSLEDAEIHTMNIRESLVQ